MAGLEVYVNGAFVAEADAKISVFDRSFIYGDGVFEGIQVEGGMLLLTGRRGDIISRVRPVPAHSTISVTASLKLLTTPVAGSNPITRT